MALVSSYNMIVTAKAGCLLKYMQPWCCQRAARDVFMCSWRWLEPLGFFFFSSLWTSDTSCRTSSRQRTDSPYTWCPSDEIQQRQVNRQVNNGILHRCLFSDSLASNVSFVAMKSDSDCPHRDNQYSKVKQRFPNSLQRKEKTSGPLTVLITNYFAINT